MAAPRWQPVALIALALALAGCAASTLPKTSADFTQVTAEMQAIAPMPSTFSLQKVGAFTGEDMSEITHDIELELNQAVAALVSESRFRLATQNFTDSALAADPELRQALFAQHQEMNKVFDQLARSKKKQIDIPYTANLDLLADRAGTDQLLFVNGSGYFKTGGAKAKDMAIAGVAAAFGVFGTTGPGSATVIHAVLVDASRGKVIWYNQGVALEDPRKPSQLLAVSKLACKPLLGPSQLPVDRSRDRVIIDKYEGLGKQNAAK